MRSIYGLSAALLMAHYMRERLDVGAFPVVAPPPVQLHDREERPRAPGQQSTVYRPPQPDHEAHLRQAEAKRERRAAKLRALSTGGDHD